MLAKNRLGETVSAFDGQGKTIDFLYNNTFGRIVLKILICPFISKTVGFFLNRRFSAVFIKSFVKNNNIDMSQYEDVKYKSYNQFFCRKIKSGARTFLEEKDVLCSPCDSKLSVFKIENDSHFKIKGGDYTFYELTKSEDLAQKYNGGYLFLFRLSVDDYHRYAYVADGTKTDNVFIKGVLHTVNPRAAECRAIYKENCREYSLLSTDAFGNILMMEVGAMMVGKIVNHHQSKEVLRGEEKGYFEFGGSTVILCFEKDTVLPDGDLLCNTASSFETVVKMGEKIGKSKKFAELKS